MRADLHVHTTASDGLLTPQELLAAAGRAGLSHLAVTDHDTVEGLETILAAADRPPFLRIIRGIEFSTDLPGCEVHILGYCIDLQHAELRRQLRLLAEDRLSRAERMVAKLGQLGFPVSYERVLALAGQAAAVGRPHVATALVERGYFSDIGAAFDAVIGHDRPAYIPHYKLTPGDTIALIRSAGGLPVLAHPGQVGDDAFVQKLIEQGIGGLEVYHPAHDAAAADKYKKMAEHYGLMITGGSDFHGFAGRFPEKVGLFTVPGELAEALCQLDCCIK